MHHFASTLRKAEMIFGIDGTITLYAKQTVVTQRQQEMIAAMAFQRKWVSDSNLDKLWHETVEKKEANKQRGSPDFCKEAILSATLKRISSEMIMRRFSSTVLGMDQDGEEGSSADLLSELEIDDFDATDGIQINSEVHSKVTCNAEALSTEKENTFPLIKSWEDDQDSSEIRDISDIDNALSDMNDIHSCVPDSPKRKRNEFEEDEVLNSSVTHQKPIGSPAKRQCRVQRTCRRNAQRSKSATLYRNRSLSPVLSENKEERAFVTPTNLKKPNSLDAKPDEDDRHSVPINCDSKQVMLTPVKSVVNSISALTLGVTETWKANSNGSWCLPGSNVSSDDPLELDNFFSNLKKLSS